MKIYLAFFLLLSHRVKNKKYNKAIVKIFTDDDDAKRNAAVLF